jgi:hypothetical protein
MGGFRKEAAHFHIFVAVSTASGLPRQDDSIWTAGWPVTRTSSPSLRSLATAPNSVQMTLLLVTRSIQPGDMRTVPLVTIGLKLSLGRFGGRGGPRVGGSVRLSGGAVVAVPAGPGEGLEPASAREPLSVALGATEPAADGDAGPPPEQPAANTSTSTRKPTPRIPPMTAGTRDRFLVLASYTYEMRIVMDVPFSESTLILTPLFGTLTP